MTKVTEIKLAITRADVVEAITNLRDEWSESKVNRTAGKLLQELDEGDLWERLQEVLRDVLEDMLDE